MIQYVKTGWSGASIRAELLAAKVLPPYEDVEWYSKVCTNVRPTKKTAGGGGYYPLPTDSIETSITITVDDLDLKRMPVTRSCIAWYGLETYSHALLFIVPPKFMGIWHVDGLQRKAVVNVPLFNCGADSTIEWTDEKLIDPSMIVTPETAKNRPPEFRSDHVPYLSYETHEGELPVTDTLVLDQVTLLRVNTWHRANNAASDKHRVSLSFRYKDNPSFEALQAKVSRIAR